MPTRLPFGLSFVKPGLVGANTAAFTVPLGDVTPDVSLGTYFVSAASALTLTNFDGGERGKIIAFRCDTGGAITIQDSAGGINITTTQFNIVANSAATITTAGNALLLADEVAWFVHNGTDWDYIGNRVIAI